MTTAALILLAYLLPGLWLVGAFRQHELTAYEHDELDQVTPRHLLPLIVLLWLPVFIIAKIRPSRRRP